MTPPGVIGVWYIHGSHLPYSYNDGIYLFRIVLCLFRLIYYLFNCLEIFVVGFPLYVSEIVIIIVINSLC